MNNKRILFDSIEDVHLELCRCYDECIEKEINSVGETLYVEHFFFCNTSELLNQEAQMTIAKYNFCKAFNCPPYPSLDETPAKLFEDFMKINKEFESQKINARNNGSK